MQTKRLFACYKKMQIEESSAEYGDYEWIPIFGTSPLLHLKAVGKNCVHKGHKCPFLKFTWQYVELLPLMPWLKFIETRSKSKTVILLYGNKDLWGPWVPQWESCFGFQAQPHDFQDIWHTPSSFCDIPGQLPWNQHKANNYRYNHTPAKTG